MDKFEILKKFAEYVAYDYKGIGDANVIANNLSRIGINPENAKMFGMEKYFELAEAPTKELSPWEMLRKEYPSRAEIGVAEEADYVEKLFDAYEKETGFSEKFHTVYNDIICSDDGKKIFHANGKKFTVSRRCTTDDLPLENLPAWVVKFENGIEDIAFPDEVCNEATEYHKVIGRGGRNYHDTDEIPVTAED